MPFSQSVGRKEKDKCIESRSLDFFPNYISKEHCNSFTICVCYSGDLTVGNFVVRPKTLSLSSGSAGVWSFKKKKKKKQETEIFFFHCSIIICIFPVYICGVKGCFVVLLVIVWKKMELMVCSVFLLEQMVSLKEKVDYSQLYSEPPTEHITASHNLLSY